jgi:hypothetical protein
VVHVFYGQYGLGTENVLLDGVCSGGRTGRRTNSSCPIFSANPSHVVEKAILPTSHSSLLKVQSVPITIWQHGLP